MSTVFPSAAAVKRYFSDEGGLPNTFDGDLRELVSEPYRYKTHIQQDKTAIHIVVEIEDPDRNDAYFEFGIFVRRTAPKMYRVTAVMVSFAGIATHDTKTVVIPDEATELAPAIMKLFKPLAANFIKKDVDLLNFNYRRQLHRTGDSEHEEVTSEFGRRANKLRFIKKFITPASKPQIKESIQYILSEPDED